MSFNILPPLVALGIAGALLTITSASKADSQLDDFRHGLSLHAGTDLIYNIGTGVDPQYAGAVNADSALHGAVDIGIGGRVGVSGVMIGGQVALQYWSIGAGWVCPGLSLGYAVPVDNTWALLPQARVVFMGPFGGNQSAYLQMTAELGFVFFGKAGFMEPLLMVGLWDSTGDGSLDTFFGVGYRMGMLL